MKISKKQIEQKEQIEQIEPKEPIEQIEQIEQIEGGFEDLRNYFRLSSLILIDEIEVVHLFKRV